MRNQIKIICILAIIPATARAGAPELFVLRQTPYGEEQSHLFQSEGKWICASDAHDFFPAIRPQAVLEAAAKLKPGEEAPACESELMLRLDGAEQGKPRRLCARDAGVSDFLRQLAKACGR